jgi:hypothetical protein
MKRFTPLVMLVFASCATAPSPPTSQVPSELKGSWKLVSFVCEGGKQDHLTKMNEDGVSSGTTQETLTFEDQLIQAKSIRWQDKAHATGCELNMSQRWEFSDHSYRVVELKAVESKPVGTASCPKSVPTSMTGDLKSYQIESGKLRLNVNHGTDKHGPPPSGGIYICEGGDWIRTYERLK